MGHCILECVNLLDAAHLCGRFIREIIINVFEYYEIPFVINYLLTFIIPHSLRKLISYS
jgi:hypothetical protein